MLPWQPLVSVNFFTVYKSVGISELLDFHTLYTWKPKAASNCKKKIIQKGTNASI